MAENKAKYKLLRGKHEGFDEEGNNKSFVTGDWILLTEEQAKAFSGKVKAEALIRAEAQVAGLAAAEPEVPVVVAAVAAVKPVTPVATK